MKRRNLKRIFMTLGILLFFAVIVCAVVYLLQYLHQINHPNLYAPYASTQAAEDAAQPVAAGDTESSTGARQGLADTLCTGEDNVNTQVVDITGCVAAGLFDLDAGTIPLAKNVYQKIYPASITKLMTGILVMEYARMDDLVVITAEDLDLEENSQVVGFHVGDTVTVGELLHGLLIQSGNDAAMALARHVGGTVEHFVSMMNDQLRDIGATGSHFTNPTGLHDENHYTTVYDIYLMLLTSVRYEHFVSAMQLGTYTLQYTNAKGEAEKIVLNSTDRYLTNNARAPKDVTILGGKTGTTTIAGHCLCIYAQNAYGEPYISVVVGAQNTELLYEEMNALLSLINT